MSIIWQFTSLDDAFFFLNQSKGMSDTPSTQPLRQRCIRASIIFSWVALEEVLGYVVETLQPESNLQGAVPTKLGDRLRFVMNALKHTSSFPSDEFRALRKVRNSLAHPTSATEDIKLLTIDQAAATFKFCSSMIQGLCPVKVVWN